MLKRIKDILGLPVVRQKILFTIVIVAFFRFVTSFTIPGVNKEVLAQIFNSNELLQIVNLMSGGLFLSLSVLSIGLGPYITASYIFQILAFAFPTIKEMFQGGPIERRMLTHYMRLVTFPIAFLQAASFIVGLQRITQSLGLPPLVVFESKLQIIAIIISLIFGAYITMWFGELITWFGLGGGSSVIIAIGILASYPLTLGSVWNLLVLNWQKLLLVGLILFLIIMSILVTLAVRKIEVIYAQRVRTTGTVGAASEFFVPINPAGVMPVIFAVAIVSAITTGLTLILRFWPTSQLAVTLFNVGNFLQRPLVYNSLMFLLTLIFAYFSTFLVFNPKNIAENLQKQGGFIPGIRPGKETERFILEVTRRVVLIGGIILGFLTITPIIVRFLLGQTIASSVGLGISGTGILIVVSVLIDIIRQLKSVETTLVQTKKYF